MIKPSLGLLGEPFLSGRLNSWEENCHDWKRHNLVRVLGVGIIGLEGENKRTGWMDKYMKITSCYLKIKSLLVISRIGMIS